MPTDTWSTAVTPVGATAGNVPVVLQAYQDAVRPHYLGMFADTAARDAAAAPLVQGMTAYVHSRLCLCVCTSTAGGGVWRWMGNPTLLYSYYLGGFADYVTVTPSTKVVANTGSMVLLGGQRLLRIDASVDWQGTTSRGGTGLGSVNASVVGNGIPGGNMFTEITRVDQPGQRTVSRSWMVQVSGTVAYSLSLIGGVVLSGSIDALDVQLQVTDFGPVG